MTGFIKFHLQNSEPLIVNIEQIASIMPARTWKEPFEVCGTEIELAFATEGEPTIYRVRESYENVVEAIAMVTLTISPSPTAAPAELKRAS